MAGHGGSAGAPAV